MTIKVCTYNVKDLFDDDAAEPKPRAQLRALARMIDLVDADIVALQEVGSEAVLQALNERLQRQYEHIAFSLGNSTRGIGLAVLSRWPLAVKSHADVALQTANNEPLMHYLTEHDALCELTSPVKFQRDVLLARVKLDDGVNLALFVVHLKSRTNRPWQIIAAHDVREAEVRAVAQIVKGHVAQHDDLVVLAGDCNDHWSADALAPLRDLGFFDPVGEAVRQNGNNPSTYWARRRMRIDHIVSLRRDGVSFAHATIHAGSMAKQASDHYPVSIELHFADQLGK